MPDTQSKEVEVKKTEEVEVKVTEQPEATTPATPGPIVTPAPVDVPSKACVVCGLASTRATWVHVSGDYVACDFHTDKEFKDAVAKQAKPSAKENKK